MLKQKTVQRPMHKICTTNGTTFYSIHTQQWHDKETKKFKDSWGDNFSIIYLSFVLKDLDGVSRNQHIIPFVEHTLPIMIPIVLSKDNLEKSAQEVAKHFKRMIHPSKQIITAQDLEKFR